MTIEIYKDVLGYEGIYQVSNLGNVKRILISKGVHKKNINFIKPLDNGIGYYRVGLCINNKQKRFLLHRLVAEVFIDNPNNYKFVNHINGVKSDNRVENLEWCTHSHNIRHAINKNLLVYLNGDNHKRSKKIINTETGEIYHSTITLSAKLGIARRTLCTWLLNPNKNKTNYRYL